MAAKDSSNHSRYPDAEDNPGPNIVDEMTVKAQSIRGDRSRFLDVNKEPEVMLPPLPSVVCTSQSSVQILSLEEAVESIEEMLNDLSDKVSYSLEKCKKPKEGLSQQESAALYLYSLQWPKGQHSVYSLFNRALRDEDRTNLIPFQKYYNLFMRALIKLPSTQEQVWRGVNGDLSKKYRPGTVHIWWGTSSCTDMVKVTDTFLDKTAPRTLFNIRCFDGKNILHHSDFPNESETILAPGTYLRVKSQSNPAPNFHIVECEQIEPIVRYLLLLNPDVNKSQENLKLKEKLRGLFGENFRTYEKMEECEQFIRQKKNDEILLIVTSQIGRQIVPTLHSLSQLTTIFVYCMDKDGNEKWSKSYLKVKAVVVRPKELINQVEKEKNKPLAVFVGSVPDEFMELSLVDKIKTPISGYEKEPLVSVEESTKSLHEQLPDVDKYVHIAKSNCEQSKDGLTQDESAAIMLYTMEWKENSLYHTLNQTLRTEDRRLIKPWFSYLKLVLTGLRKLPSFEGIVWLGVQRDMREQYKEGKRGVWWNFSSATLNAAVCHSFLGTTGARTLLSIQCKDGKHLGSHSSFQEEENILLLPGFCYEVVSVLQTAADMHLINLKEIGMY